MKHRRFALLAGGVAALAATFGVLADHPAVSTNLGTPVHAESFDRVIPIGPKTRWANVTRNETIKFVITTAKGKTRSIVWRFDTLGTPVIELRSIAPPATSMCTSLLTRMTEAANACRAVMTGSASVRA